MDPGWQAAAPVSALDAKYPLLVTIGETEIALCRVGDEVYAVENFCTHACARLSDGMMRDHELLCPLHGGSFDVRTGAPVELPCDEPVRTFPTRIDQDNVFVKVGEG